MNNLFLIIFCISFLCILIFTLWALINLIRKKPAKKRFVSAGISALVLIISTIGFGLTMDATILSDSNSVTDEAPDTVAEPATQQPTVTPMAQPSPEPTAMPTVQPIPEPTDASSPQSAKASSLKERKYSSLSEIELDELQQLYLDFDPSLSYSDAINYVVGTGLPYSEEKYNGSRTIQIAFTEGCTAQKYMKESGDYLTIDYRYPKDENSINDDLSKYIFSSCEYVPLDSYLSLTFTEATVFISRLGTQLELDTSISKEDQMLYYFNNK